MLHARGDYNRIQDHSGKIPMDEPVFLIRAKDPTSGDAVRAWADLAEAAGSEARLVTAVRVWAARMDAYRLAQATQHGPPDAPPGVLVTETDYHHSSWPAPKPTV